MTGAGNTSRRRRFDRWRLVSPSGAEVVSLRQLPPRERLRLLLPSIFTTCNMMSGLASVMLALRGQYREAAVLIALAILMDILDGAIARLVGATSPFGIQLDSLADLVSFGVAPAILLHTWALPGWPVLGWIGAFMWLACAAFRLARFNVTTDPTADKRYFVGLPSPAAAAVIMVTIFALDTPMVGSGPVALALPLGIALVPALLMVTTVRFRSFRSLIAPQTSRARIGAIALFLMIAVVVWREPGPAGMVLAYGYVLQAPLGVLTAPLRERLLGPGSVAPPRTRLRSVFLQVVDDDGLDDTHEEPSESNHTGPSCP